MIKNILTIAVTTTLFLSACSETPKQENAETTTTESLEEVQDDFVTTISRDKEGNELEIVFNNTKGTATFVFDGETVDLQQQKTASGYWYKNDNYELIGKGNNIDLTKNGELVFTYKDDIVNTSIKNKEGQTLDLTFNNSTGTAKVYLDGGDQIDLVAEKAASGIWYKNDQYELRGKGVNLELTKDGKTVFKN